MGSLGLVVSQLPPTVGQKDLLVQVRAARYVCVPFAKRGRVVIDFGAHYVMSDEDCAAWPKWAD